MEQKMPFEDGPFLSAALVCERVLEERDGVKSAIRIIDRVIMEAAGPRPPDKLQPFDFRLALLIKLKSGSARGPFNLRIVLVKPSGESPPPIQQTIYFEGEEDKGVDVVANIVMPIEFEGVYWFWVFLNDVRLTQIPLRVMYIPQVRQIYGPGGTPPPGPGSPGGA